MVERKVLVFNPHLCSGCMFCMTACSTYNEGSTSFSKARLQIFRHEGHAISRIDEEDELVFSLVTCQQCEDPVCAVACPAAAIKRDISTGAMNIDLEKCLGCRMCIMACPFGAIAFHARNGAPYKCELCDGDPQCVKFCEPQALEFMSIEREPMAKRARTSDNVMRSWLEKPPQISQTGD